MKKDGDRHVDISYGFCHFETYLKVCTGFLSKTHVLGRENVPCTTEDIKCIFQLYNLDLDHLLILQAIFYCS